MQHLRPLLEREVTSGLFVLPGTLTIASTSDTTPTSTSGRYPPLTTLFTPDPSCSSFYLEGCSNELCSADAFPNAGCIDETRLRTVRSYLSCYPSTIINGDLPILTYSPGYFCPVGMTTVVDISSPDAVWCCPAGLTWEAGLRTGVCGTTITHGTFISTNSNDCFGENTTAIVGTTGYQELAISVSASAILLTGRKLFTITTPLTSTSSLSTASSSLSTHPSGHEDSLADQPAIIAIIVVSIFATLIFLLALLYIRRLKKRKTITEAHAKQADEIKHNEHTGKPELGGSKAYVYTAKAELDATTTRAELEGNAGELYGDGIYVVKPELEGSTGTGRNIGVYVNKKSELEAVSTPRAVITQQQLTELEAVSLSSTDGASVVTRLGH